MTPEKCPTCQSHAPHLHPAQSWGGEVSICSDTFHQIITTQNTPERLAEVNELQTKLKGAPGAAPQSVGGVAVTDGFPPFGCDPEDSARLLRLRMAIDDHLEWFDEKQQEAGDYEGCVRHQAELVKGLRAEVSEYEDDLNAIERVLVKHGYDTEGDERAADFITRLLQRIES
jgi:hypothetical protein